MPINRLVEYAFFFGLLAVVGYLIWELLSPFINALALAAVVVTICHPLHRRVVARMPRQNETLGALAMTLIVIIIVLVPLLLLGSFIFKEAVSIYNLFNNGHTISLSQTFTDVEILVSELIPGFSLNIESYVTQIADFIASHIATVFAGTASTIFQFFIALIATFYFFRDGSSFTKYLIEISPLRDDEDDIIIRRLSRSIRSVVVGIVLVALIQGVLTSIGMSVVGFDRAVLWGGIAAIGALVPGVGTSVVFIPAIVYLIATGSYIAAVILALWAMLAVGLIDNFLGPYLISRGGTLHPFMILLAVLGGIAFFGPIGFIIGPVILSFFKVLLEIYAKHIAVNFVK